MPSKHSSSSSKSRQHSPKGSSGKGLKKSQSLPSISASYSSPFDAPQPLCTVQVRKRCIDRSAVSSGSIKQLSQSRMAFTTFERGLEWERSHVVARVPDKKLPPLHEVIRLATKEFNLNPKKMKDKDKRSGKKDRGEKREEEPEEKKPPRIHYSPYLGGPRLPMRGRVIDSIRPQSASLKLEVTAPAEDGQPASAEEKTAEGKAPVDVPSSGGGASSGEAVTKSPDPQAVEDDQENHAAKAAKAADAFAPDDLPFPWDDDELRSAFSRFDTDRDGELHSEELPTLLRYLGARPQTADADMIVKDLTSYATLSWEEVLEFLHRWRKLDVQRMYDQFMAADDDGSGELDFDELHQLLEKLGYYPTAQSTLEAFEYMDKDKSSSIAFTEFEGLREYLRITEGFTKADYAELGSLFEKSGLGKAGPEEVVEEVWRITMYLGYSAVIESIERFCDQVNPERANGITANEMLKIVRAVRETEISDMIVTMKKYGDDPHRLPCEDLGLALTDLGYFVSEDAVNEILEGLGECETEESLTLQEFGAFLRGYRRIEGFTESEVAELQEIFDQEGRLEPGALHTLEVGKVLRWFGFARTVQEVHRLVEGIDLDGSGVLEFTEFVKLMRRLHQDEAEKRQCIFYELATESPHGELEVHISKLEEAVTLIAGAEPDPSFVDSATKSLQAEMSGSPRGSGDSEPPAPSIVFINKQGFEAWFRHFHRLIVADVRASAGYGIAEKAWLQQLFNEYDEDGSGTIERGELLLLLATYFPDSTKSKESQREVQKALDAVDTSGTGELDFNAFLQLSRKCDDWRDSRDVHLEIEVVQECGFTPEEVDGFRQIFSANVDWKGELDLGTLAQILSRLIALSEDDLQNLSMVVCQVHPQGREVARFPQFLKLVKRLTEENYGQLNDQAARFLKRQQQQQQMLQTARRLALVQ